MQWPRQVLDEHLISQQQPPPPPPRRYPARRGNKAGLCVSSRLSRQQQQQLEPRSFPSYLVPPWSS